MDKITDYNIVIAHDERELIEKVLAKIEEGWELQGGVGLSKNGYPCQTMIKTASRY